MTAWLLTNTFYGTWLPGDERGSVTSVRDARPEDEPTPFRHEHDIPGTPYETEILGLRRSALNQMKGPAIYFDLEKAEVLFAQLQETAEYRGRQLRAVAIMRNHLHIVVLAPDDPDPARMLADFKAYGSRALNRRYGKPLSETWWTEKGSKRRLKDDAAVEAAINYVLYEQEAPLLVWSPETGRIV